MKFRDARSTDLPAILAMLADDAIGASRESSDVGPSYRRAFAAIEADPRNRLIVADRDGEAVGVLQMTYLPSLSRRGAERAQLEGIRVRADVRGQGIGRRMIEWATVQARGRGCGLVQLTTDKRRTEAQRFYSSLGFTATHIGMKLDLE